MVRYDAFADRHIGPSRLEKQQMLDFLGFTVSSNFHFSNNIQWLRNEVSVYWLVEGAANVLKKKRVRLQGSSP